ncbi:MAG: hypothetical protein HY674_22480 [Chloroflexi bacterium]|nr:hypothetical protein [Chloroflexota bacterium]
MSKKMQQNDVNRRDFLMSLGLGSAAVTGSERSVQGAEEKPPLPGSISIDPKPKFELSPYLYMQFMEPLGVTDSSVDAAWDFANDAWREDVVEITQELAPTLLRWGGCFCSYYRWQEGVGPMSQRKPMLNQLWGGIYNNQVGTHEFVDFCRRVGADPLFVVNFEADGRKYWAVSPKGEVRAGTAHEAAEWVDYCNHPANTLRHQHGIQDPYRVKLWQIGNETSYEPEGFNVETAAKKTLEFAKAMRKADPTIDIIGWGDSGWAGRMAEQRRHDPRAWRQIVHDAGGHGHEPLPKAYRNTGRGNHGRTRRPGCNGQPHGRPRFPPRGQHPSHAVSQINLPYPREKDLRRPRLLVCPRAGVRGLRLRPGTDLSPGTRPGPAVRLDFPGGFGFGGGTDHGRCVALPSLDQLG